MNECNQKNINCTNLILRTANTGHFEGQKFFGCKLYPRCNYTIQLYFDETLMSNKQKIIKEVFRGFVRSNTFLYATFGYVYYNLRDTAFMDYLLKSDIVMNSGVEIGLTGAKVFGELYDNLLLIPSDETKRYLINNFPGHYSRLYNYGPIQTLLGTVENYDNFIPNESSILPYKDFYSNWNISQF